MSLLRNGFRFFRTMVLPWTPTTKAAYVVPEMDASAEVPEITTACWDILDAKPDDMMCASARMIVKHKAKRYPLLWRVRRCLR